MTLKKKNKNLIFFKLVNCFINKIMITFEPMHQPRPPLFDRQLNLQCGFLYLFKKSNSLLVFGWNEYNWFVWKNWDKCILNKKLTAQSWFPEMGQLKLIVSWNPHYFFICIYLFIYFITNIPFVEAQNMHDYQPPA